MTDAAGDLARISPAYAGPPKLAVQDLVVTRVSSTGTPVTAVDHVSFRVDPGEFVCLIGPSGCGKTSILNVLAGLERPTSGQATVDGHAITGPGPDRAVLFQEPALFPWLSIRANVELAIRLSHRPAGRLGGARVADRRAEAERWLDTVGLGRHADVQPHELSAGMRQRAALARALAADPEVLLGDEPFAQLDAQARELLQNEVQRVWVGSEGHRTFLFVTHNVREAALLADRVLVMTAGPGRLLEEVRIRAPRPRDLDDVLVGRVVSEIHELLMREVDAGDARQVDR